MSEPSEGLPLYVRIRSTCFFVFYDVPAQWIGMHADPWPADVQKRSYFSGPVCGEGSDRPCPDPALPLPTKRSGHIGTDGGLVLPSGAELPGAVPFERPEQEREP
ncbi:hypothetical protein [Actinocorallia longicatena]|uniref:Uncharacterized protein n=1 Tax=Actinocorallia longicatena TaxID=111803 RepID=A0ABP6Q7P1_9ACTN